MSSIIAQLSEMAKASKQRMWLAHQARLAGMWRAAAASKAWAWHLAKALKRQWRRRGASAWRSA